MKKGLIVAGLIVAGGAAVFVAAVFLARSPASESSVSTDRVAAASQAIATNSVARRRSVAIPVDTASLRQREERRKLATNLVAQAEALSDDELMDKVVKELLAAVEQARREGDANRVLDLVAKLRQLNYGVGSKSGSSRGGSSSVKRRILEALKELGVAGLPEVIDLVNDEDPSIAQSATKLIFDSLQDISLGDYNRADIVVAAAEEMTDSYSLTRLFQQFQRMRHSVGVEALTAISHSGSTEAKAKLSNAISTFTRDLSVTEADQLAQWLADNPDQPQDDWFYGGIVLESQRAEGQK